MSKGFINIHLAIFSFLLALSFCQLVCGWLPGDPDDHRMLFKWDTSKKAHVVTIDPDEKATQREKRGIKVKSGQPMIFKHGTPVYISPTDVDDEDGASMILKELREMQNNIQDPSFMKKSHAMKTTMAMDEIEMVAAPAPETTTRKNFRKVLKSRQAPDQQADPMTAPMTGVDEVCKDPKKKCRRHMECCSELCDWRTMMCV